MTSTTVAAVLVETLVKAGGETGLWPGDSLNALTDTIRQTLGIEWRHVRHEETGAFAAGATPMNP